jgi:hypothetical protein
MSEFWMFIATIVLGFGWLYVSCFIIAKLEYIVDHLGGGLVGMTPTEVDVVREWRERR